jgi:hypothetical protein
LLVQRAHASALAVDSPAHRALLRAPRSSAHALVLASAGRLDEARAMAKPICGLTKLLSREFFSPRRCCALNGRSVDAVEKVAELEWTVLYWRRRPLVTAYRANADLLAVLLHGISPPHRVVTLIRRAGDEDLAEAVGHSIGPG